VVILVPFWCHFGVIWRCKLSLGFVQWLGCTVFVCLFLSWVGICCLLVGGSSGVYLFWWSQLGFGRVWWAGVWCRVDVDRGVVAVVAMLYLLCGLAYLKVVLVGLLGFTCVVIGSCLAVVLGFVVGLYAVAKFGCLNVLLGYVVWVGVSFERMLG